MLVMQEVSIKDNQGRIFVDHLSFALNRNDKIAIVGEEGNGKSTLMKYIYQEQLVKQYCQTSGTVLKNNHTIGYLPQSLEEAWHEHSITSFLLQAHPQEELSWEQYNELQSFLALCGVVQLPCEIIEHDQKMATLSGGEKIKVQLLKILHQQPDVLLLDEPTNDLDIPTLEWLEEYLIGIDMPLLLISHDETLLERVANGIIHLEQLEKKQVAMHTFERIGYRAYVEKRMHLIDRQNRIADKQQQQQQKQLEKWNQIYQKVEHRQATISRGDPHGGQLLKNKMKQVKAMKRRIDKVELTSSIEPEEAISLFFKSKPVPPGKIILDYHQDVLCIGERVLSQDISLLVRGRDKVVIVGTNGCGKTTLLHHIYPALQHQGISFGYMPQDYLSLLQLDQSPIDYLVPSQEKEKITIARNHLGSAKFTPEEMEQPMQRLSGGQRVKVVVIGLLLGEFDVLLLDEPTRNLSPLSNPVIRQLFASHTGAMISVSHDRNFIADVATQVYELRRDGLHLLQRM